ncbi:MULTISPECIES: DUF2076 domain-containing protein [Enterobacteriaceae]|uniref:DUF2076 domain-containing protein n=1 Tax=Enterobacteriaceae TaxID=543 RepID=UPI000272B28B|nr:DUF2076 domain-containing protein [Enterobacter sp. Ag1]EJF32643.1 hypothetical protein A936_03088 [Enterobacter sp. Ag1]
MQAEEQRLIDGLFDRLKQAESQSATRDAAAEQRIAQHLSQQPGAAYYMTQTILIQEAAMKQLNGKIQALEAQVSELEQKSRQQQSSGGFLAGLFGGGSSSNNTARGSDPIPGSQNYGTSSAPGYGAPQQGGYGAPQQQAAPASAPRAGGGFLSGALQTAAGVAGGVVVAEMLTSMFHRSQPEEIVNIINEPAPTFDNSSFDSVNDYSQVDDRQFQNQGGWQSQDNTDYGNDDFGGDDYGDDDDDSFI